MSSAAQPAASAEARVIPHEASARLVRNLSALVAAAQEALASPAADPGQKPRWTRAAQQLGRDLEAVKQAVPLASAGEQAALAAHASRLRFLARRMDGYRLDFAGPAFAEALESQRRLTVLVAWQIHAFASGSRASGL